MKPAKRKERRRSTNLELLGGVSLGALRTLRDIASRADLPLERVFRDVVAIGLSVVSDPEESPYQSLIAFRQGLANKQAELGHADTNSQLEEQTRAEAGSRDAPADQPSALSTFDLESIDAPQPESGARPGAALERSGQLSADAEDSGLALAEG